MTTPKPQFGGSLWVKAGKTSVITNKATSASGYQDFSDLVVAFDPVLTAETRRLGHRAGRQIQLVATERLAGTLTISLVRNDAGTPDPHNFFNGIMWQTQAASNQIGRFQFIYNPTKVTAPAAATNNPQHIGSAVVTELTPWETHQGLLVLTVRAELDEDYRVHDS